MTPEEKAAETVAGHALLKDIDEQIKALQAERAEIRHRLNRRDVGPKITRFVERMSERLAARARAEKALAEERRNPVAFNELAEDRHERDTCHEPAL